jgi:hypothetical protein
MWNSLLNKESEFRIQLEIRLLTPERQSLQRGKPQRQFPTEGNPPSELAPQRAGSS